MAEMPSLETMRSRGSHRPRSLEAAFVYVKEARRRLARDPSDADALFALVMWFAILGQPAMSIGLLDRLTRMDLEYPGVWSLRASRQSKRSLSGWPVGLGVSQVSLGHPCPFEHAAQGGQCFPHRSLFAVRSETGLPRPFRGRAYRPIGPRALGSPPVGRPSASLMTYALATVNAPQLPMVLLWLSLTANRGSRVTLRVPWPSRLCPSPRSYAASGSS